MIKLLLSALLVGNLYSLALPVVMSEAPPNADPLRWLYQVEREPAPVVADVLRGPYGERAGQEPVVADVLRGPYDGIGQEASIFAAVPGTRYEDGGFIPPAGTNILRVPNEKMCCSESPSLVDAGTTTHGVQETQNLEKIAQASQNWADYAGEGVVAQDGEAQWYDTADSLRYPYSWEDHQGAAPVLAYIAEQQEEAAKMAVSDGESNTDSSTRHMLGH